MNEEITLNLEGPEGRSIRITATPSPIIPQQCMFHASEQLFADNSAYFADRDAGQGSPIVERVFDLGDVFDVLVSHDCLRVTVTTEPNWDEMIPKVGAVIRDVIASGEPAISEAVTKNQLPAEELERRVQDVLDNTIIPAIAAHGGMVRLIDVMNNTVFLSFGGGCQGCGMVSVTLKYGVERAIREEVPEVGDILDTTDHAAGHNPYYAT